jgi:uncharacterized peroxidase-related enzyme
MQRIDRVNEASAPEKSAALLEAVRKQMGGVPNILATMAQSPAALGGYLAFAEALSGGSFNARQREQIALAVAGANACDYCASAHSTLAGMHGVAKDEVMRNLRGGSACARTEAALTFTRQVLATRGNVSEADLQAVREAGYGDDEIIEIVANTALNIFTNYFNHVAGTEIDFPMVRATTAAA